MSQPAAQQQLSAQWLRPCLALLMTMAIMLPAAAQYKAARTAFGDPAAGGDVRGYNSFWLDRGTKLARVRGEIRTSWVDAPATGPKLHC